MNGIVFGIGIQSGCSRKISDREFRIEKSISDLGFRISDGKEDLRLTINDLRFAKAGSYSIEDGRLTTCHLKYKIGNKA